MNSDHTSKLSELVHFLNTPKLDQIIPNEFSQVPLCTQQLQESLQGIIICIILINQTCMVIVIWFEL